MMHVLVLPFPGQGHLTPMLHFSKRLHSKGLKITLLSCFIQPGWLRPPPTISLELQLVKPLSPLAAHARGAHHPVLLPRQRLDGDSDYGVGLFQAEEDGCREWLDLKGDGSVVYVAFGSLVSMGEERMAEIAMGLRNIGKFLWVVRDMEVKKLPTGFREETKDRGLVVNWCHQLQVLNHRAVGCFVSHCGWNSTLEALCLGVPVVGIPSWSDQPTNAKFVADVWQGG